MAAERVTHIFKIQAWACRSMHTGLPLYESDHPAALIWGWALGSSDHPPHTHLGPRARTRLHGAPVLIQWQPRTHTAARPCLNFKNLSDTLRGHVSRYVIPLAPLTGESCFRGLSFSMPTIRLQALLMICVLVQPLMMGNAFVVRTGVQQRPSLVDRSPATAGTAAVIGISIALNSTRAHHFR